MTETDDERPRSPDRDAADAVLRKHRPGANDHRPEARVEPPDGSSAVSLMITRRQRVQLRALGFSDDSIRSMNPAEAHGHLGLDKPDR